MTVRIVVEGLLLGALPAAFCAIGIRNGAVNMVFLYHADVQERCIRNGLITREAIRQKAAAFKGLGIAVYLIFLLVSVYAVNGARGFWIGLAYPMRAWDDGSSRDGSYRGSYEGRSYHSDEMKEKLRRLADEADDERVKRALHAAMQSI